MLNDKQIEAVNHFDTTLRIVAGAGTGKTRTLTEKVITAIEDGFVKEWQVLALTFTNKAANEMKERIEKSLGHKPSCYISTFHSLCYRILREDIDQIGIPKTFNMIDTSDRTSIIKKIIKGSDFEGDIKPKALSQFISNNKRDRILPHEIEKDEMDPELTFIIDCYMRYQKKLKELNALDFDDLILQTETLFDKSMVTREKWAMKFKLVLVDEFQDTDDVQYEIVKMLAAHSQLVVVGDPDQTIYTWRGAKPFIFTRGLEKDFADLKTITLDKNYRSNQNILNLANTVISNNKERIKKNLYSDKVSNLKPHYFKAFNNAEESMWVCHAINDLIKAGNKFSDIAVLFRAGFASRDLENKFMSRQIPFKIYGGIRFIERAEVKDSLAYLKTAVLKDTLSLERIINKPKRKIGAVALSKIQNYAEDNNMSLFDAAFNSDLSISPSVNKELETLGNIFKNVDLTMKISDIIQHLIEKSGYLASINSILDSGKIDNIKELKRWVDSYQKENKDATLNDFLNEAVISATSNDDLVGDDNVSMMTIHASKGLEFKYVFIIGVCDWILPSPNALAENYMNIEEERRLFYVAVTRAEDVVFVSSYGGRTFDGKFSMPSQFIEEGGSHNYQIARKVGEDRPRKSETHHEGGVHFENGDIVTHTVFGEGAVLNCGKEIVQIAFKKPYGIKSLNKRHKSLSLVK